MLKYKLTETEYDALEESQQGLYEGDAEKGFELQVDLDNSPIKLANEENKTKAKSYLALLRENDIDPTVDDNKTDRERELEAEVKALRGDKNADTIQLAIEQAARADGVKESVFVDLTEVAAKRFEVDEAGDVVTKDADGLPDGLTPAEWLTESKKTRRHWWAGSKGAGADGSGDGGSNISNPYSKGSFDLMAQMRLEQSSPTKAANLRNQALPGK